MKKPIKLSSFILLFSLGLLVAQRQAAAQNSSLNGNKTLFDVAVVLDLGTPLGKMSEICISMALDDFYSTHNNYTTKLNLLWRDSNQDNVDAASMVLDLLKNVQVKAIIGPQTSAQAQFVVELGNKAHVPILSFSATYPSLASIRTPYFIRTALSDSSQVKSIAAVITAFKWSEVVLIYEDTPYGNGVIPYLIDALQEVGSHVSNMSMISHLMTDDQIAQELYKLDKVQSKVFVVHLSPFLSSRVFLKANEVGMLSEGYVWIITYGQAIFLDSINSSVIQSMQGVLGVRPYYAGSKKLDHFMERWKRRFLNENPNFDRVELNLFGLWAYDTVWVLAKAAEEVLRTSLGASEMGSRLRDAILKTNFKGLSGEFNLTSGQLESSVFEIVNVVGKGDRVVGFWTPINGLDRKLNTNNKTFSTFFKDLWPIIWPGGSTIVPRGTMIPSEKLLRIAVPIKGGINQFFSRLVHDPLTTTTYCAGFSLDVFRTATKLLPYPIGYEFIPFEVKADNDIFHQVYSKNFDAAVGDITISASRTKYVDFTLPYLESDVRMVVLAEKKGNAWIFLKPFRLNLWLITGVAFVVTGAVVWALEHRVNDEFRGPLDQQIGVMLWFSFSTLVFAHRERLVSNWSRLVVIIWLFVVWILTTGYAASFTSLLTLQQLQPAIDNINDLIRNGDNVGYQQGSAVVDLLRSLNVEEAKLKAYATLEDYAEALSKGTVGAIVDESPYLRIFIAKEGNCGKFKMVERPIYKTDGFGFVFPINSPLVHDMSSAILSVKQGSDMRKIEKKWIDGETICSDQSSAAPSNSLTLDSFWGLFLITGVVSYSALMIFFFKLLRKNWHLLHNSSVCFVQRLKAILRCFDERDPSHYTPGGSIGHAENSPPNVNGGTTPAINEVGANAQHFQPFDCDPVARKRWKMLYRAWQFRSRYAHLD